MHTDQKDQAPSAKRSELDNDHHHSELHLKLDCQNPIPPEYLTSQGETAKEVEDRLRMLIHDLRSPLLLLKMLFTKLETELKHKAEAEAAGKTYSHLRALPGMEALARTGVGAGASTVSGSSASPYTNFGTSSGASLLSTSEISAIVSACGRMHSLINSSWDATTPRHVSSAECLSIRGLQRFINEKEIEYLNDPKVAIRLIIHPGVDAAEVIYDHLWPIPAGTLLRILSNLINNSVEARRLDCVRITVEVDQEFNIIVRDNGIGMPDDICRRLGKMPLSIGKDGHSESGSGIGIWGATRLLAKFGGLIRIDSIEGSGTSIKIHFPNR